MAGVAAAMGAASWAHCTGTAALPTPPRVIAKLELQVNLQRPRMHRGHLHRGLRPQTLAMLNTIPAEHESVSSSRATLITRAMKRRRHMTGRADIHTGTGFQVGGQPHGEMGGGPAIDEVHSHRPVPQLDVAMNLGQGAGQDPRGPRSRRARRARAEMKSSRSPTAAAAVMGALPPPPSDTAECAHDSSEAGPAVSSRRPTARRDRDVLRHLRDRRATARPARLPSARTSPAGVCRCRQAAAGPERVLIDGDPAINLREFECLGACDHGPDRLGGPACCWARSSTTTLQATSTTIPGPGRPCCRREQVMNRQERRRAGRRAARQASRRVNPTAHMISCSATIDSRPGRAQVSAARPLGGSEAGCDSSPRPPSRRSRPGPAQPRRRRVHRPA